MFSHAQVKSTRTLLARGAKAAGIGLVTVPTTTAVVVTAVDAFTKRGRTRRAQFTRPGTFDNEVGTSSVRIFTYGADLYEEMIAAIEQAQQSVLLETYLWKSDEVGQRFKDALEAAAERGVDVKVIFDRTGNLVVNPKFYRFSDKVQVYPFPVLRPRTLIAPIRNSGLTHRKILVVDDETAFMGGYNIGDLYATQWRDTHVKLVGPEAWELRHAFMVVWNKLAAKHTKLERIPANESWNANIRSVDNIPARRVYPIRAMYLEAIDKADHHIYMTTAYFIPDQQILEALENAAERGVDVQLLIPKDSNHIVADFVSRGYWRRLLDAGITVLLYEDAMIHAKTMTIDGKWSTIGSANVDRLSLGFNYEVNIEITDSDVARSMEQIFEADATNAHILTRDEWEQRHGLARIAEILLAPLAPFL